MKMKARSVAYPFFHRGAAKLVSKELYTCEDVCLAFYNGKYGDGEACIQTPAECQLQTVSNLSELNNGVIITIAPVVKARASASSLKMRLTQGIKIGVTGAVKPNR
jgi:hypothetical protein